MNENIKKYAEKCYAADVIQDDVSELINFALILLDNKIESEDIFILAGLSENEKYESRHYFEKVINALDINIDKNKIDYFFICYLNDKVQSGKIKPRNAVSILYELYNKSDRKIFWEWFVFEYQIEMLEEGLVLLNSTMTLSNINEYIRECFKLATILGTLELPEKFEESAYCKKCGTRIIPRSVEKRFFFKRELQYVCPNCSGKDFIWCSDNEGKKLYLKEIGYKFEEELS